MPRLLRIDGRIPRKWYTAWLCVVRDGRASVCTISRVRYVSASGGGGPESPSHGGNGGDGTQSILSADESLNGRYPDALHN